MLSFVKKIILPIILGSGFLLLYIHNLSRAIYGGDVGDLVTAAAIGGVAHPPGYPLFTLLGFLLTHTPLSFISPAFAVGMISAIAASLGIVIFFFMTKKLTNSNLAACVASLTLGFSFLYWFYAEVAEVFALNAFFGIILFFLAITYRQTKKQLVLFLFFLFLGLSATHHQTIVFLYPSLFLLIGKDLIRFLRKKNYYALFYILFLLLGTLPFLYLFIASFHHPIVNWDNVHDLSSFFHLILRKDYGTFQAGIFDTPSLSQRLLTIRLYFQYLIFQLTIPICVLTLVGFWKFFKTDKVLFFSILFAWILSGPVFLAYAGFPLTSSFIIGAYERFTLLSFVIFLIPLGNGLVVCATFLASFLPKRHYETVFQAVFLIIPLMLCIYNFPKTNLSTVGIGQTYAQDFLDILPKNSVLLISGDTQIFNTWYLHFVLHDRSDVLLYNIGATPVGNNIIAKKLEGVASSKKSDVMIATIRDLQQDHRVFSSSRFQPKTGSQLIWVPYGLIYEMVQNPSSVPDKKTYEEEVDAVWSRMHVPKQNSDFANHSLTIAEIPTDYSNALIATGSFIYSQYQDVQKTLLLYKRAVDIAPGNDKAYSALGVLYMGIAGKCSDAAVNLSASLAINSYQETPYFLLYNTYINCFKDTKKAKEVSEAYTAIFQKNFLDEMKKSKTTAELTTE